MAEKNETIKESELSELDHEYEEVMEEMEQDVRLDKFRIQFEKLHNALKDASNSNQRLQVKNREINAELVANASKVAQSVKQNQDDQVSIMQLKSELSKAWMLFDSANEKEQRLLENVQSYKVEIENLTMLCEKSKNNTNGTGEGISELSKQKQAFQKERDHLIEETQKLRVAMQDAEEQIMELEASSAEALQSNAELRQEVQTRQNDLALQERQKDVMEKELKQTLAECEEKTGEIKTLTNQLMKTRDENTVLFGQVKDLKSTGERSNKENRLLETRFNRLQGEYQAQADVADQLAADIQKKLNELKSRDDEIGKLKQEMARLKTMREAVQRKLQNSEEVRVENELKRDTLKSQLIALEKERERLLKIREQDKKHVDELARERDILNKNYLKASAATSKQLDLVTDRLTNSPWTS
jgi:chromosome segregation ATPase